MLTIKNIFWVLLCLTLSAKAQITSPEQFLGHKPGADYKLTTYEQWVDYLNILDEESPRIQLGDMGETTEGRRMIYAIISSVANLNQLNQIKDAARRLSLLDIESSQEAAALAKNGKAIVWISAGLHSTEVAPPQHHFQLPYDMITSEDETIRMIRDSVVLLLPIVNPDGMTQVAEWYRQNLGTDYEVSPLPKLYNRYAGHDNNRDTFIANLKETQNINRAINEEWFLSLFYDQHQSAPFPARIWIPPGPEPTNPNKHPIIIRTKNLIGSAMGKGLEENDQPGAISRIAFDIWYPGYIDGPAIEGHNIPSILTETALYKYATPKTYTIEDFPEEYKELRMGVFYPSPWKGGEWHIGDAVAYNLTASKALLEAVAKYKFDFLYNKYKMAQDVVSRFEQEGPYGWVIPAAQADKGTMALMLERMMGNGVQVFQAQKAIDTEGASIKEGDFIIPTNQPFGLYVKNIMESQDYPDLRKYPHLWQGISRMVKWDGAPFLPYDGVGWTLPAQMGVETRTLKQPVDVEMEALEKSPKVAAVKGSGRYMVISASENNAFKLANAMLRQKEAKVIRSNAANTIEGMEFPAGSFWIDAKSIDAGALTEKYNVPITLSDALMSGTSLKKVKVGLYDSWVANMDAGWIKLLLDQYGFDYNELRDEEVKQGNLHKTYDVIIIPDQRPDQIIEGHKEGAMPPEYVGGIGEDGLEALKSFVANGGKIITNKRASQLAIETFGLSVRDVLADKDFADFTCPGSILKVDYDSGNPVAYGMPKNGIGYFAQGMAFDVEGSEVEVIATYPAESLLVSGWLEGEEIIQEKAAVVRSKYEKGEIVLFGFNVQNRMQAYGTIKLMMNALVNP